MTPNRAARAAAVGLTLAITLLACGTDDATNVVSEAPSTAEQSAGAGSTSDVTATGDEEVPESVLVQSREFDVDEMSARLQEHGLRNFEPAPPTPSDIAWQDAVSTAMGYDAGATFDDTYVVRGRFVGVHLPTQEPPPAREAWMVVMRGLEMSSLGGPYGPDDNGEQAVSTELIVFVDAETGEFIEGKSFR